MYYHKGMRLYLLEEIVLGSAGQFTFSSIPGTYDSLFVEGMLKSTYTGATTDNVLLTVNSDTTDGNYQRASNYQGSFTAGSDRISGACATSSGSANMAFSPYRGWCLEYANGSMDHTWQTFSAREVSNAPQLIQVNIYRNNVAAITAVNFSAQNGASSNFATSSVMRLYGVRNR